MQAHVKSGAKLLVFVLLGLSWCPTGWCAAKGKAPAKSTVSTNNAAALLPAEIPKSIFVIPSNPREGRNPFFPQAAVQPPPPDKTRTSGKQPPKTDASLFVVNGITPVGPRITIIINNHTFEVGESAEIKLANGAKAMVKCLEIRADSVLIEVDGQKIELKFKLGL